jgi:hypothetical protein
VDDDSEEAALIDKDEKTGVMVAVEAKALKDNISDDKPRKLVEAEKKEMGAVKMKVRDFFFSLPNFLPSIQDWSKENNSVCFCRFMECMRRLQVVFWWYWPSLLYIQSTRQDLSCR